VTNISFGAAIAGNGRMTLDNFRILGSGSGHASASTSGFASTRALVGGLLIGLLLMPVVGAVVYDRAAPALARLTPVAAEPPAEDAAPAAHG
jgi:hypothetical protein